MNILFVSDHYLPAVNGIVKQMITIKKELESRGHKVLVVAPKFDPESKEMKDVFHIPSLPFFIRPQDRLTIPFDRKIEKLLMATPIDIIHSHGFLSGLLGIKIAHKKGIPQVVTLHTSFQEYSRWLLPWAKHLTPPITNWLSYLYFNQFDTVIAPSIKAVKALKKSQVKTPVATIHNGIEMTELEKISPDVFLKKYHLNKKNPLIILVGRIDIGKNVHLAIKAMKKIVKKIPDVQLAIIGDGHLRKRMKSLIKRSKLSENIFITGFLDHDMVMSANKAATLSIMTSDSDTLPTVAIEAIACGKPMVAVNDDAITCIIKHGVNGLLTTKDPGRIATAILKLLRNKKLRTKYSQACTKIAQEFSIESYVNKLQKLYEELIIIKRKEAQLRFDTHVG